MQPALGVRRRTAPNGNTAARQSSVSAWKPCAKPSGISSAHAVVGREALGVPLQEGRRAGSKVDGDVPDVAAQAAHELHLGMRRMLEMQAAHRRRGGGQRVVDLRDRALPAGVPPIRRRRTGATGSRAHRRAAARCTTLDAGERRVVDGEARFTVAAGLVSRRCRLRTEARASAPSLRRAIPVHRALRPPRASGQRGVTPKRRARLRDFERQPARFVRAAVVALVDAIRRARYAARASSITSRTVAASSVRGPKLQASASAGRCHSARRAAGSRPAARARAATAGRPADGESAAALAATARREPHRESAGPRPSRRRRSRCRRAPSRRATPCSRRNASR